MWIEETIKLMVKFVDSVWKVRNSNINETNTDKYVKLAMIQKKEKNTFFYSFLYLIKTDKLLLDAA